MECPICYDEIVESEKWESSDVESAQISIITIDTHNPHHRVRSLSLRPSNHMIQVPVIQCPTRKHDLCNRCMIKWMKESLEQQRDVNCVICNQEIHSITRYRREIMREAQEQREAREEAIAEQRLHQMIRGSLERNIREINGIMGKLCCWSGVGFGISFMILIFYPGDTTKLTYFMLVYIGVCSLIMMGLFFNRLFYISQLNEMNRIHPELRDSQVSLGNERLPI